MEKPFVTRNLKFNFIVNVLDGGFFGFAIGFASFTTMLPLFVSNLTDSALLIGLIPAIHNMGWQLPQLFTANRIARKRVLKPLVLMMSIHERVPFLGFAIVALLIPVIGKNMALVLSFLLLVWQGLGSGFAANPWQVFVAKIIPSDTFATFIGTQSAAANLLASIGAVTAGFLLEHLTFPNNFALCFFIASGLFVVSWLLLYQSREPEREPDAGIGQTGDIFKNVMGILRKDRPFLWYLISRVVYQFGMMAFAFYMVYGVKHLELTEGKAGIMTSVLLITMVVSNPLLGWLADHWSKRWVLELGALAGVVSALLAYFATSMDAFYLVFILNGIANTAFWSVGIAYTMSFGTEEERPTYVGMANTLIAPSAILAPLVGGWLADSAGYHTTFIVSAALGLLAVFVIHHSGSRKPKEPVQLATP